MQIREEDSRTRGSVWNHDSFCGAPEGKDTLLWGAMPFTWVFSCCYSSDQMQEDSGGVLGKKIGFRQTGSRERILSLDRGHLLPITWAIGSVSPIRHVHSGYRHSCVATNTTGPQNHQINQRISRLHSLFSVADTPDTFHFRESVKSFICPKI